jgi:GAF domain-containing protein
MTATVDNAVADLQRANAELQRQLDERTAERDEALQRETATAEVLGIINSSPGDLAPVFDAMLEKATRLCEADFGILWNFDGDLAKAGALHRVPTAYAEMIRAPFRPSPESGPARMMRGEGTFVVADLLEFPPYHAGDTLVRAIVDLAGARSVVISPLRKDAVTLGAITIYRQEVRPFSDNQIALLQNFAAQAVIAMENARLITETREALNQQTATAEVLQVINSSPGDLAPVFDAMLEKAHTLCGATQGALVTFDGEWFRARATRGMPDSFAELLRQGFPPVPGSATDQLARGECVHTLDLAAYAAESLPEVARFVQPALDLAGTRTILMVPLRKDDALLGYIAAYRQEVRSFSDKQIALLQNFAAQAVIAIENARLLTETRDALEQQTATAEVLQVINASPGDLNPVFESILDKAHTLCGADRGALVIYDGEYFRGVVTHGMPETFASVVKQPVRAEPGSVHERLLRGDSLVHIPDMAKFPAIRPVGRAAAEAGTRTVLVVPLRKDTALLGYITAHRTEVRPFADQQIALLQNFAEQAVIAMENARLITETREALDQQTATAEVLGVINSSPGDLTPVFDAILEKAHNLCEAPRGGLILYDGEYFRAVAVRGFSGAFADQLRQGIRGSVTYFEAPLLAGEHFVHIPDQVQLEHPAARAGALAGTRTLLSVPLRKDDALVGMIIAGRTEVRPFTDKQIALLQNFATQAVIAMENARLLGELRQRTDEVAELNRGLEARVAEQVDELGRVGRLKRFLAPQLAELIVSQEDENILESHRREIVVVFCDLRGYTAYTETAEPEEVLHFLREYHGALGPLVSQFEGTLDQFSGDGIMVFFNDPVPILDPAGRAVKMAMAMREAAGELIAVWRPRGCELGFGVGIAQGYATLGQIGFADRSGYTAIGTVCNLAARLCAEAKDGQILLAGRVAAAVEAVTSLEDMGNISLKGLSRPVAVFNAVAVGAAASAS